MPCRECQHFIRSATSGIKWALKPYWKNKCLGDQPWALVLSYLRQIEIQAESKARNSRRRKMLIALYMIVGGLLLVGLGLYFGARGLPW